MYKVILVTQSQTWLGGSKLKWKLKGKAETLPEAEAIKAACLAKIYTISKPDYRIFDDEQWKAFLLEVDADEKRRREEGKKKAAKTRKKNAANGKKPSFVLCPECRQRSKKLHSEFGGFETRVCKSGHRFTYDRWIADRAFWNPASVLYVYGRANDPK